MATHDADRGAQVVAPPGLGTVIDRERGHGQTFEGAASFCDANLAVAGCRSQRTGRF
jgi:hypothetical protein